MMPRRPAGATLCRLRLERVGEETGSGLDPVLDVGGTHPVRQARLADPEVGRDLPRMLSWLTVASHADNVLAELTGVG
jgi:hypothetical protein